MGDERMTMEEAVIFYRNRVVSLLSAATGVSIRLSDEQDPEALPPYGYYSLITPYASSGELGNHVRTVITDVQTQKLYIQNIRAEHAQMHFSFTFCSKNRHLAGGADIVGENEAMQLALKGAGWLRQEGAQALSLIGLAVLRVGNLASRSGVIADEYVRRWGFDVALRYKAITVRTDDIVERINVYHKK